MAHNTLTVSALLATLLAWPLAGCHDLDALSADRESGGRGGSSGASGTGGSSGAGGSSGSAGSGGAGGGSGAGGDSGAGGSAGTSDVGAVRCGGQDCDGFTNPADGSYCCTVPGTGSIGGELEYAGRAEDLCGVQLDQVDSSFDDTCWQLEQPGTEDSSCPGQSSDAYGPLTGCCTDDGYCGVVLDALGFGCTYAIGGVGRPCGDNPITGCDPADGFDCSGELCRPIYVEERQLGTWGCTDPSLTPGYGQGSDCSEGWYEVATGVYADPCGEGLSCVYEDKLYDGWSCQPHCEAQLPCSTSQERCREYDDPQGFDLKLPACDPTDDCTLPPLLSPVLPSGCAMGESCFLSYDWYGYGVHSQCFVQDASSGLDVGDECLALDECPTGSVCIGPLGVDAVDWGDGDPSHAFRCTEVCDPTLGVVGCSNCVELPAWGMDTSGISNPPSLCVL